MDSDRISEIALGYLSVAIGMVNSLDTQGDSSGAEDFTDSVLPHFGYVTDLIFFFIQGEKIAYWLPVYTTDLT